MGTSAWWFKNVWSQESLTVKYILPKPPQDRFILYYLYIRLCIIFVPFSLQFGQPPIPIHQPAFLCQTTATSWGRRRLTRAFSGMCEVTQMLIISKVCWRCVTGQKQVPLPHASANRCPWLASASVIDRRMWVTERAIWQFDQRLLSHFWEWY